jgi:hypothetical protein
MLGPAAAHRISVKVASVVRSAAVALVLVSVGCGSCQERRERGTAPPTFLPKQEEAPLVTEEVDPRWGPRPPWAVHSTNSSNSNLDAFVGVWIHRFVVDAYEGEENGEERRADYRVLSCASIVESDEQAHVSIATTGSELHTCGFDGVGMIGPDGSLVVREGIRVVDYDSDDPDAPDLGPHCWARLESSEAGLEITDVWPSVPCQLELCGARTSLDGEVFPSAGREDGDGCPTEPPTPVAGAN